MTDSRWLFRHRPLAFPSTLVLVVLLVACDGGAPAAPVPGPGSAAEAELTSDLVTRPLPNPTSEVIINWAPLPGGREWGTTAGVDIGPDGHIWAYDRCGGGLGAGSCETNPELDAVFKLDRHTGEVLTSFGAGPQPWLAERRADRTGLRGPADRVHSPARARVASVQRGGW